MNRYRAGFWGKGETNCEWCGHEWRTGESIRMYSDDGLPGHETLACQACYNELMEAE